MFYRRRRKEMSELKERVETFIRRYYDLEVIISQNSRELPTKSGKKFSDLLGNTIASYVACRHGGNQPTETNIAECFAVITLAYSNGFVEPGQDLIRRLDECRKQNSELVKDLAICMANYTALKKEHGRLLDTLEQNQNPISDKDE
jgi:hypothetical protein